MEKFEFAHPFSGDLKGDVTLADTKIQFQSFEASVEQQSIKMEVHVDQFSDWNYEEIEAEETYICDAKDFSKALAIAIHWGGMPNAERDYPEAEKAMGEIRWIP